MKGIALLILAFVPIVSFSADQSPYAGEEFRSLKSLSPGEVEALKSGQGMGFARLAELNHFPGPRHVLELADELGLKGSRLEATEALFQEMRTRAIALGKALLKAEMDLERDFGRNAISPDSLEKALVEIGRKRTQLRYVHLEAHLRQKELLTAAQISRYDELRGYEGAATDHNGHSIVHH